MITNIYANINTVTNIYTDTNTDINSEKQLPGINTSKFYEKH